MKREDELRLVDEAKRGSESAFEALVSDNQKLVYGLALKMTGNPDDALDVSQEAFIKAYTRLSGFRGESRFSVWLYRLTYNTCLDFLKKSHQATVISLSQDDDEKEIDIPDPEPAPDTQAELSELRDEVRAAIYELPEDKRRIIIMREFSNLSYTEMAEILEINEGTVKSRLARARQALAEILVKHGTFPDPSSSKPVKGGRFDG